MTRDELAAKKQFVKAVEHLMLKLTPEEVGRIADDVSEHGTDGDGGALEDSVVVECLRVIVDNHPGGAKPMSYTVYCQRCDRPASTSRALRCSASWIFAIATGRSIDEVRLCASCVKTVDSLTLAVAKVKKRTHARRR
jgi:hypothetical protein